MPLATCFRSGKHRQGRSCYRTRFVSRCRMPSLRCRPHGRLWALRHKAASTNLSVIQQQGYLAQARSTEVSARSVWIKARVALDRAVGNLLDKNGITYEDSVLGQLPGSTQQ